MATISGDLPNIPKSWDIYQPLWHAIGLKHEDNRILWVLAR